MMKQSVRTIFLSLLALSLMHISHYLTSCTPSVSKGPVHVEIVGEKGTPKALNYPIGIYDPNDLLDSKDFYGAMSDFGFEPKPAGLDIFNQVFDSYETEGLSPPKHIEPPRIPVEIPEHIIIAELSVSAASTSAAIELLRDQARKLGADGLVIVSRYQDSRIKGGNTIRTYDPYTHTSTIVGATPITVVHDYVVAAKAIRYISAQDSTATSVQSH